MVTGGRYAFMANSRTHIYDVEKDKWQADQFFSPDVSNLPM